MKRFGPVLASCVALCAVASPLAAGEFEASLFAGYTYPFYSQTFTYDPGPVDIPIPNLTVQQTGTFSIDAKGGLSIGGSATYFLADAVGIELRLDTANINADPKPATYRVRAEVPPLPAVTTNLDLGAGTVDVDTLKPISLNLRLRTPGPVRFIASGGISYLPTFGVRVSQTLGLGVTTVNLQTQRLEVGTLAFRAVIDPATNPDPALQSNSRWGLNAGAGFQFGGERASLVVEARYFHFPEREVAWEKDDSRPLSAVEQLLLTAVQNRLPSLRFEPNFVQATAGISIRF
jgi:hypothetical protein